MGRLRTETIKIDPALLHRTPASAELTPAILADYSARMRAQRRREIKAMAGVLALVAIVCLNYFALIQALEAAAW